MAAAAIIARGAVLALIAAGVRLAPALGFLVAEP
jgi:hypothetical protein